MCFKAIPKLAYPYFSPEEGKASHQSHQEGWDTDGKSRTGGKHAAAAAASAAKHADAPTESVLTIVKQTLASRFDVSHCSAVACPKTRFLKPGQRLDLRTSSNIKNRATKTKKKDVRSEDDDKVGAAPEVRIVAFTWNFYFIFQQKISFEAEFSPIELCADKCRVLRMISFLKALFHDMHFNFKVLF